MRNNIDLSQRFRWVDNPQEPTVMVVQKPSGIVSNGDDRSFEAFVRQRYPGMQAVHRLDKGTSGLIIFARTSTRRIQIMNLLKTRGVKKDYLAVATGDLSIPVGVPYLSRQPLKNTKHGKAKLDIHNGRMTTTIFELLATNGQYSLLKARLVTGAMHQIRVHLSLLNMPIYGDWVYGDQDCESAFGKEHRSFALHSYRVQFDLGDREIIVNSLLELEPSLYSLIEKEFGFECLSDLAIVSSPIVSASSLEMVEVF